MPPQRGGGEIVASGGSRQSGPVSHARGSRSLARTIGTDSYSLAIVLARSCSGPSRERVVEHVIWYLDGTELARQGHRPIFLGATRGSHEAARGHTGRPRRQKHLFRLNKSRCAFPWTRQTFNVGRLFLGATDVRSSSVQGRVQRCAGLHFKVSGRRVISGRHGWHPAGRRTTSWAPGSK